MLALFNSDDFTLLMFNFELRSIVKKVSFAKLKLKLNLICFIDWETLRTINPSMDYS